MTDSKHTHLVPVDDCDFHGPDGACALEIALREDRVIVGHWHGDPYESAWVTLSPEDAARLVSELVYVLAARR